MRPQSFYASSDRAEDVAEVPVLFASFPSNALTGISLVVSHGWHIQ